MATIPTTRAQLASALSGASGLEYHVAYNWLSAENSQVGHGTNPLGIRCGNSRGSGLEIGCDGSGFAIYASAADGVKAAAWLLFHSGWAKPIVQAIAAGNPQAQRAAIVASPWAAGNYHGGSGFNQTDIPSHDAAINPSSVPAFAGFAQQTSSPSSSAKPASSGPSTLATLLPPGTSVSSLKGAEAAAGVSTDDSYRLTSSDAQALAGALKWPAAAGLAGVINGLVYQALGQPNSFNPAFTETVNGILGGILPAIAGDLVGLALLAGLLGLGYVGLRKTIG